MKKVWINPGCIACGACAFIAPEVFEVTDMSRVKPLESLESYCSQIKEAATMCPVNVIEYKDDSNNK